MRGVFSCSSAGPPFRLHYENEMVVTKANDRFGTGASSARKPTKGEIRPSAGEPEAAGAERDAGRCESGGAAAAGCERGGGGEDLELSKGGGECYEKDMIYGWDVTMSGLAILVLRGSMALAYSRGVWARMQQLAMVLF